MNGNHDMSSEEILLAEVCRRTAMYSHCLVAYSGGLDSSVLLNLMTRIRQQHHISLRAVYVHHGLNPLADSWAEHCRQQCQRWQVPFDVLHVDVDARQKGIEAAAREARYQALKNHLLPGEALLTAQHLDDQSETFLLALKRGSGPAGLASMAEHSSSNGHVLLRPLLTFSRTQLEAYAQTQQLSWIEDDSNGDDRFDRNFLRLHVLPLLKQRWPHFLSAVARSAALCAEQEQLLDELLAESLQAISDADGALYIDALMPLSPARRFALLRRWIAKQGAKMPSRDQLQRVWQEVAMSKQDAEPQLQLGNVQVRRFRQQLYLLPRMDSLKSCILPWQLASSSLVLPDGLGCLMLASHGTHVRSPREGEQVTVRFMAQGKIHIVGRQHGRQIKKLWQEMGVPPWQRERTPLLFYNEQIIAAVGVFITMEGQVQHGEDGWHIDWQR
ncbi:tRNA lysidine(34) synthetase TilS [Pectobacteriaceae bacterium C111]|nr:tRNA lysidine(34) synthetase TilS [Pectobacteriaceae bacterium C111]